MLKAFLQSNMGLPNSLVDAVAPYYRKEQIAKGQYITKENQYCKKMCLVQKGYFRFYTHSDKKEITHWILGSEQLVTDVGSFFLNQPSKWNIQALVDTEVFTLSQETYNTLETAIPRWNHYEKLFLVKLMSALENRVYTLLSMNAERRYQYLMEADANILQELPQHYIASMLGMSPETMSRIRAKAIS